MRKAYRAPRIFTGKEWIKDFTILTSGGKITQVLAYSEGGTNIAAERFPDCIIIPALIDVQVYGAAHKLFSVFPEADTLHVMNEEFRKTGTVLFQPTVATNDLEVFHKCIDAVREYWKGGGKGVAGIHLEGPWINPKRRGAHIEKFIHPPQLKEVQELLEYGRDVIRMITLAPECCSPQVIDLISNAGIVVSVGHSDASYRQATEAFDRGIPAVTHLFNAMSPLHHREPGLVGAAFDHHNVMASIIPDGHHVAFEAVGIAKKLMGNRLFAITDAVTETDSGPYQHHLAGDKYEAGGILSGSAISMLDGLVNLVQKAGIDLDEAVKMCSLYPAELLGCADKYGKIAPGYSEEFLVLDKDLKLVKLISSKA
jgi:N-acetylglucosamine-6-phosphate deacetylase